MAFSYYRSITIDHTKCGSVNTSDFPTLVSTKDAASAVKTSLKSTGNGGHVQHGSGYDVQFFSDGGLTTRLAAERVTWDASTGIGEWWVKAPTLSASVDTVIYIAYGDAGISTDPNSDGTYGTTSAWASAFKAVLHLADGTTLSALDSTSNGNDGTVSGATAAIGQIDGAAAFDGVNDKITFSGIATGNNFTLQFWIYPIAGSHAYASLLSNNAGDKGLFFRGALNKISYYDAGDHLNNSAMSDDTWNHYAMVCEQSVGYTFYVNGVSDGFVGTDTNFNVETMGDDPFSETFNGRIDEMRISTTVRTPSYMLATYNNQFIPDKNASASGFYTVGSETNLGGAPASASFFTRSTRFFPRRF